MCTLISGLRDRDLRLHGSGEAYEAHLLCSSQEDVWRRLQALKEVRRDNGVKVLLSIKAD